MNVVLPKIFKPEFLYDLIRLGSSHDGGYVIEKNSLINSEFMFSFGISTNWKFEKDFISKKRIKFLAFDGSINNFFWELERKNAIKRLKKLSLNKYVNYKIKKYLFYRFFNDENFQSKFISNTLPNSIIFEDVIKLSNFNNNFFKIDIEGSEYDILEDLINFQEKIIGIAIEFHNCINNIDKIINFISNLNLKLVHIHVNNYDFDLSLNFPKTMEISFSKEPKILGKFISLPHYLDRPNRSKTPEIKINFHGK